MANGTAPYQWELCANCRFEGAPVLELNHSLRSICRRYFIRISINGCNVFVLLFFLFFFASRNEFSCMTYHFVGLFFVFMKKLLIVWNDWNTWRVMQSCEYRLECLNSCSMQRSLTFSFSYQWHWWNEIVMNFTNGSTNLYYSTFYNCLKFTEISPGDSIFPVNFHVGLYLSLSGHNRDQSVLD